MDVIKLQVPQLPEPVIIVSSSQDGAGDGDAAGAAVVVVGGGGQVGFVPVGIGTLYLEDLGLLQVGSLAGLDASSSNHFVPSSPDVPYSSHSQCAIVFGIPNKPPRAMG